jgi:hypothetical protein
MKYLNVIIAFAFCSILSSPENVKGQAFSEGDQVLSFGLGVGSVGYLDYVGSFGFSPALTVSYDKGIKNDVGPGNIGIGGLIGFKRVSSNYFYDRYRWTDMVLAARVSYHLNELDIDELDVYGALHPGIRIQTYRHRYSNNVWGVNSSNGANVFPYVGISVGCSYYLTPKIGIFAELGYEVYFAKFGVNVKI